MMVMFRLSFVTFMGLAAFAPTKAFTATNPTTTRVSKAMTSQMMAVNPMEEGKARAVVVDHDDDRSVDGRIEVPSWLMTTAASVMLSAFLMLSSPTLADANSKTAGQISLNSVPPTSILVDIGDLPVVGNLLSGTYTKVSAGTVKEKPSVVITSPKDKVSAIKDVATGGHLEFDINGLIGTHLDVDVAAEESGVATVRVASPLIPPLPFKNKAVVSPSVALKGNKASDWVQVTNLGNGETYYFNEKTEVSQFEKPN